MKKIAIIITAATSLISHTVFANELGGVYCTYDFGYIFSSASVKDGGFSYSMLDKAGFGRFKNSFSYSIGAGYALNKFLRADLTYHNVYNAKLMGEISINKSTWTASQVIPIEAAMMNVYVNMPLLVIAVPYVGIGVGFSQIGSTTYFADNVSVGTSYVGTADAQNFFSYSATAGINIQLTPKIDIGLGYRFQNYGSPKAMVVSQGFSSRPRALPETETKTYPIRLHTVICNLRFTF